MALLSNLWIECNAWFNGTILSSSAFQKEKNADYPVGFSAFFLRICPTNIASYTDCFTPLSNHEHAILCFASREN
jgi:hypothetical protein